MKKKILIIFLIMFLIIIIGLFLIKLALNNYYNKEFNKFNYNSAKQKTIKLLNKNEAKLETIVNELYESKTLIEKPSESIKTSSYRYDEYFNYNNEVEYIKFYMDAQGRLSGQEYGLIYIKENDEEFITYHEQYGNNIFIRQKIKDNWYFYYDDYDGKVDINKIRKD